MSETKDTPNCELCGEPMPVGEEMFKYHGYSGPCPKTTKVKHTPGPWASRDATPTEIPSLLLTFPASSVIERHGIVIAVATMHNSGAEAVANAQILAAAPDLLNALKAAAAAINPSDRQGISLMTWNDRLKAATVTINAAIAKAEGRS
jgi:hypothetical protein